MPPGVLSLPQGWIGRGLRPLLACWLALLGTEGRGEPARWRLARLPSPGVQTVATVAVEPSRVAWPPAEPGRNLRLQSPEPSSRRDWAPRSFWEPGQWIPPSGAVADTLERAAQHRLIAWPVVSEPWEHRPWGASFRLAALWGDNIVDRQLRLETDALWEFSLSRRWKPYWTWELRWAWSQPDVATYTGTKLPRADVILFDLAARRTFFQSHHWRWSLLLGVGGATFSFNDENGVPQDQTVWQFPLGLAMEYRWDDQWSLLLQLRDQMVLGGGHRLETMHLVSLGLGVEYRFGGSLPSYWPWVPEP